jgi:hypothetical protein
MNYHVKYIHTKKFNKIFIKPTSQDKKKHVQTIVDYKLSRERVVQQKNMRNTNRVEAFHRKTLKLLPKDKTYRRHYESRCFSAVHTHSVGITEAVLQLHKYTGASLTPGSRAIISLLKLEKRLKYQQKYAKSWAVRMRRKQLKKKQIWVKANRNLSLSDGVRNQKDHNYPLSNT